MNTVFSRNKEKRPRSSTNESNNSFVKNVTSRVSGLLPATITKWFSSPSSSNANGSAPAADVTDSSTEDEAPESPISSQPPAKRMRYGTPGKQIRFNSTDVNPVPRSVESKETPTLPYNTVQSPPGRNTFRRETNFVSTPVRASEESVVEKNEKDTPLFKTQHTISVIGPTVATKRKSLFEALSTSDSPKAKPTLNTSRDTKLPTFKPALLGSPFYHGRTMYGGAASSYINQPNIKQRKVAYVKESDTSDTATMSHSTRRILDLLENYSSPLTEAKRIPKYVKQPRNESLIVKPETSPNNTNKSYKMQELHVPGIASVLRLKQKSRLMDTTSAARQLIASYSSATEYNPYPSSTNNIRKDNTSKDSGSNLTTKVKSRVARPLRGDSVNEPPPPPVELPNVVLQIEQLPKFTLEKPVTPAFSVADSTITTSSTPSKMTAVTTAGISSVFSIPYYITMSPTSTSSSKPGITCNNTQFKFSSPVRVSSETAENCKIPPKFAFGSPDHSVDRPKVDDKKVDSSVVVGSMKETAKSVDNTKDWKCSECWVSNKPNTDSCACCGNKKDNAPIEKQAKCVVCKLANSQSHVNKCVNCEKAQTKTSDANTMKPVSKSQWKCDECWVDNNDQATKCVCCGATKPNKSNTVATKTDSSDDIWKCFICWITNKNNEENCSCCGTSRDFASFNKSSKCSVCKTADSQPNNNKCADCEKFKSDNTGKSGLSEKSQWKCEECWVSNEENAEKCVCCGAGNPKTLANVYTKEESNAATNSSYNSNSEWRCDDCWITNKGDLDKCDACGGSKPDNKPSSTSRGFGMAAPSSFKSDDVFKNIASSQNGSKWECSSCLVRNDDDKTICVCCGADREYKMQNVGLKSFNFGQNTGNTFKFGINANFQNTNATKMEHTTIGDDIAVDECETNNNVLDKTPTFTFTLPTKKSEDSLKVTKENKTEAPKINFSFGIPKQTNEVPVTNKPLEPNKDVEEKQSLQEVPKVEQISNVQSPTKQQQQQLPTMFTPPVSSTAAPSPVVLALLGSDKKDILLNSSPPQSVAASTQVSQTENKFAFSVGGIKPSMNIFSVQTPTTASPAPAASTPTLFPSQLKPATSVSTVPSMSLFQKPGGNTTSTVTMFANKDPVTTSTVSLFQKSETVTTTAGTASFFSFGTNTQTTTQSPIEKPKFTFTFGSNKTETPAVFKPSFGSLGDSSGGTNKFAMPVPNMLSGGNGLSGNPMGGPNGLSTGNPLTGNISTPGNILGATNEMSANPLSGGSGLQNTSSMSGNIFGAPVIKENLWPSNNNNNNNNSGSNIFVSNTGGASMLQKPATFTFGSSSPFSTNNPTPTFGASPQPVQNLFGMANQNSAPHQTLFASPTPNQAAPPVFGAPAQPSNPAPSMSMFGTPNAAATPTFGSMNQTIPSFEAPSMAPGPGAPFNFGSPQPSAVFGFGQQQQQQQQQPQQSGVYNFGATAGAAPQVQFNMGSVPNTTQRRVRKAVRRNPTR